MVQPVFAMAGEAHQPWLLKTFNNQKYKLLMPSQRGGFFISGAMYFWVYHIFGT